MDEIGQGKAELEDVAKLANIARGKSDKPQEGYSYSFEDECFVEGDDRLKQRIAVAAGVITGNMFLEEIKLALINNGIGEHEIRIDQAAHDIILIGTGLNKFHARNIKRWFTSAPRRGTWGIRFYNITEIK